VRGCKEHGEGIASLCARYLFRGLMCSLRCFLVSPPTIVYLLDEVAAAADVSNFFGAALHLYILQSNGKGSTAFLL